VPQFQASRAKYPENLIGFGYFDFQKPDWPAVRDTWLAAAKKSAQAGDTNSAKNFGSGKDAVPAWLSQLDLQVLTRHLHYSSSVSWKDSKGIHLDEWIE
jgi:hypothetical protein